MNAAGCSLFDQEGKLLKKYLGWVCTYFPNGKMLIGDGFTLTFYDEKMKVVWAKDVHAHHMITFTPEAGVATVIASNIIGGDTRIDRLEVYDQEGKLLSFFDFQPRDSVYTHKQDWDFPVFPYVKKGLTMIESFYPITANASALPFLKAGNFLAYDSSGWLYFFDSKLKPIHKMNLRDWKYSELRDVQVTPAGNLLVYNSGNGSGKERYTSLDEIDPANGQLVSRYAATPPNSFFGAYEGNVQLLPNGNLLYSVVQDELKGKDRRVIRPEEREPWMDVQGFWRAFEATREGKIIWKISNDGSGLSGMPNVVKRMDLSGYLKNKGRF